MADHYYTNNPSVESNRQSFDFMLNETKFSFITDAGVFSKKEIDFGSRLLIETFVSPETDGGILDVGCGYGPIGISIAKRYNDKQITMVDVNERALQLATENAEKNQVKNVTVLKSFIYESVQNNKYAAILSNPPIRAGKKVVHEILENAFDRLVDKGELWIVIQKKQGAPSAIDKLTDVFDEVEVVVKKKGYYIIKAKKG
ncbi:MULTISPECIES: class I SAM-dependent methyltransferase [Bacillus]|uniref:class I SAM-dependent methyltransferase n=1 Tax=Bacillus TaxID=1386 RepID=UPI000BB8E6E2|nr:MULTISPECIES: class I SAM-dependent methyltransferase [Bacillus]